ncbi:hypothetical protein DM02DRAFT_612712 [Periconia macrospinosa]|uniref:FUN14-domain-containing protein n=1 Tax=Periconia macrospinosa TaxID=97972 RepID=A0A2V1DX32_9PLEO|nr:hypothetical protein DM02DRAFT_612712 [Periconia macrospinosa]
MILTPLRHQFNSRVPRPSTIACRGFSAVFRKELPPFQPFVLAGSESHLHHELSKYILHRTRPQASKPSARIDSKVNRPIQRKNMAFLLPGLRRTLILTAPFVLSAPLLGHLHHRPILCDSPDPLTKITSDLKKNYAQNAQTPLIKTSGAPNPRAIRQISMGSILGVLMGLGVSVFSKPLAILLGLGIVCVQFLESRGIHIIPYSYLQRRFKQTNVRSLVQDNVAFKLSFGATFALAAFAEF